MAGGRHCNAWERDKIGGLPTLVPLVLPLLCVQYLLPGTRPSRKIISSTFSHSETTSYGRRGGVDDGDDVSVGERREKNNSY